MPDANGAFKGTGWSRAREDAWERVFGPVPSERTPEVPPDCNGCGEDGHVQDDCPCHPER